MSSMLDRSIRDSTVIPTMKCAQCNQDVHIRLIGQHQCPEQPPVPSFPKDFKSRGLSTFFDVADSGDRKAIESRAFPDAYKPSLSFLAEDPDAADDFDFSDILPGSANHDSGLDNGSFYRDGPSPNRPHTDRIGNESNASIDAYMSDINPLNSSKQGGGSSSGPQSSHSSRQPLPEQESGRDNSSRLEEAREQLLGVLPVSKPDSSHDRPGNSGSSRGIPTQTPAAPATAAAPALGAYNRSSSSDLLQRLADRMATDGITAPTTTGSAATINSAMGRGSTAAAAAASASSSSPSAPWHKSKGSSSSASSSNGTLNTTKSHLQTSMDNTLHAHPSTSRGDSPAAGTIAKAQTKPKRSGNAIVPGTTTTTAAPAGKLEDRGKGDGTHIKLASSSVDAQIRISSRNPSAKPSSPAASPLSPTAAHKSPRSNTGTSSSTPNSSTKMPLGASSAQTTLDMLSSLIPPSPSSDASSITMGSPYEPRPQLPVPSSPQPVYGSTSAGQSLSRGQQQQRKPSPIPLPRLNTQLMGGRGTPAFRAPSKGRNGGPASAGSTKGGKTAKLDSLLDDLMGEMQALNVEMRTESDRESVVSSNSFRHSPTSPSNDAAFLNGARKARLNSSVSTASTSSTLSGGTSCFACRGRIGNSNPACVGSHVFHRMCFRCSDCDRLLDPNHPASFHALVAEGEPDGIRYVCDRHRSVSAQSQSQSQSQIKNADHSKPVHASSRPQQHCASCGAGISTASGSIVKSSEAGSGDLPASVQGVECHGRVYCLKDYRQQLGPTCKACSLPCGSSKDSVQALDSWWHRRCFTCQKCHKSFPDKSFYVFEQMPYCKYDYHKLNGSLCVACQEPIEGPCAQVYEGRFHPGCFACYECGQPLRNVYYNLNGRFLCEQHIHQQKAFKSANKRKTVFGHV